MTVVYVCHCRACGMQAWWFTMDDAQLWGTCHYEPYLLGWLRVGGIAGREAVVLS